jgi:hypothetical protein
MAVPPAAVMGVTASVGHLAGQVILPSLTAYGLFLAALWAGSRTPTPRTRACDPPASLDDWGKLVRFLGATAAGGFVTFLVLVLVFYLALGGRGRGFVADALGSGAMLAFAVVVPSLLALEALRAIARRAGRRRR